MIYLDKEIEITWSTNTRNYYVERGYVFTGWGDTFLVKVRDLRVRARRRYPAAVTIAAKTIGLILFPHTAMRSNAVVPVRRSL